MDAKHVVAANDDSDSVVSAVYNPSQSRDMHLINSPLKPQQNDETLRHYSKSAVVDEGGNRNTLRRNETEVMTDDPHYDDESFSLLMDLDDDDDEDDGDISEDYFPTHVNAALANTKQEKPLIEQDESGLIKKIKIPVTKLGQNISSGKTVKLIKVIPANLIDEKSTQQRSSTPLSREYVALQKSFNDSKILKEFVTDSSEKTRKARAREQNSISTPTTPSTSTTSTDHSYTSRRRSNNNSLISPEKDLISHSIIIGQTKRHCNNKRFGSLKGEEVDTSAEDLSDRPLRSRSKSMHNSDHSDNSNSSTSHQLLKKWPSDERIAIAGGGKRTNMRSENVEFVQKQKDFLQHVINSTQDTPRHRSRSRSTGIELIGNATQMKSSKYKERSCKRIATEFEADDEKDRQRSRSRSTGNASGVESPTGNSSSQLKHHKPKERSSKRSKADLDDGDMSLSQTIAMECNTTTDDHDYDSSVNNSNNSAAANVNTSPDVTTTTTDNVECLEKHLKKVWQTPPKPGSDIFCWKCHQSHVNLSCSKCIRSFHTRCAKAKVDDNWICPECTTVDNILNSTKRSRRNELSVDLLSQLLSFALNCMRQRCPKGNFALPSEKANVYKNIIVNPINFGMLQQKIDMKEYRCAEEFVNETKWMIHNAYILSSGNNTKTVMAAKGILKVCRQEVNEIETCAECYLNANTRDDWFVDVCSQPHLLLWAKLKGFPYWPAKAMGLGVNSSVNVRFFGQHDRAFVSVKECFLYSIEDPNVQSGKKAAKKLVDCMKEVEEHIEKIRCKVGGFNYAPYKTPYDPSDEMKQLEEMMPGVVDFIKKQQIMRSKPSLQFKIYKTADNHLSIVQKASSTPELPTAQPQTEMDDFLHTSSKKKKCSSSEEEKKTDVTACPLMSAKYEVISKVTSDDSNSSKLSTVILKRKSANGDTKKCPEEEITTDLPLPKMQKIEAISAEDDLNNSQQSTKRKLEIGNGESKSKEKHARQDHKIPVITIKTITADKDLSIVTSEATRTAKDVNVTIKDVVSVNPTPPPTATSKPQAQSESSASTQMVVEHLVKHKQGVTIKKIHPVAPTISVPTTNTTASVAVVSRTLPHSVVPVALTQAVNLNTSNLKTQNTSPKSPAHSKECSTKGKSEEERHREEQKVISILKGLVPFVEIKKEITSDNEEEPTVSIAKETMVNEKRSDPKRSSSSAPGTTKAAKEGTTLTHNDSAEGNTDTALTRVKDEVFSDEEHVNESSAQNTDSLKQQTAFVQTEKSNISNTTNEIRVVGGTTIQKISTKNNAQQSSVNPNKRPSLKGIPYGPLPASAYPKLCEESSSSSPIQNDIVGTLPRAKKSFPQLSPTTDKLKSATSGNGSVKVPVLTTSTSGHVNLSTQHLDAGKRSMAKTTMVAIPVDVAATTRTSSSMGTFLGSIPVPPLTAVSKTTPSTSAYNTMATRNTSGTTTVSGAEGSSSTPPVMAIKAATVTPLVSPLVSTASLSSSTSTPPVVVRNSPITVVTNTTTSTTTASTTTAITASTLNTSTLTSTITTTTSAIATNPANLANPFSMSAPPPLVGLSGLNLNSALPNGGATMPVSETTTTLVPTTVTETQPPAGTDTHILGGLVTPTLASAITDIICRGPPQLAAKPNGPLQSEGHPMFPSQAGPVCKRLVDNAHKLTDFFISVMEDTMGEMAIGDDANLQAKITIATLELERNNLNHEQQIAELKRSSDLMLCEMRKSMENEKTRVVNETRKQCELEWKQRELDWKRIVEETKRKQWCAHCGREANFYCCWNTSYCDYPCQQLHWGRHASNCAQTRPTTQDVLAPIVTANNLQNSTGTQERHHGAKTSNMSSASLITPNVNTKTLSSKKEKALVKNVTSNNQLMAPSPMPTPVVAASSVALRSSSNPADVLKLPTNTFLRPVSASTLNNQTLRCNTTYSIPVQRYSLPITTPANSTSNGTHTFTILHQGNSWVMSGANTGTSSSTVAAPIVSIPQITQHRSSGNMTAANKSTKTQIRYH